MSRGEYAAVRYPWRAAIELRGSAPAAFYAALIGQALRYGLPASRRFGPAWAFAGRRGAPEGLLARAVRRFPRTPRPDLDEVRESLLEAWPRLRERARELPPRPDTISLLALERSAALTVFAFSGAARPLLVAKVPAPGDARAELEARALEEAEPAGIVPRYLARVGEAHVQEGLPGAPLRVEPLTPETAAALRWSPAHENLAAGLASLARATAKPQVSEELRAPVESALASGLLEHGDERRLAAAWSDVESAAVSVLRHHDTSAQNCLFDDVRLVGVVDWEMAESNGAAGFDVWNAALSYMEYGIGLVRWSQERVVSAFAASWRRSAFWDDARRAARASAVAGGFPEHRLDSLEAVFFGSRIGDRLLRPHVAYPTDARTSARLFEVATRD